MKKTAQLGVLQVLEERSIVIRVPLKEDLRHCLILGIDSRIGIAEILSYAGSADEVLPLL